MNMIEQIQEQIEIRKAIISHDDKLEYFKRELLKILEKQAESENKPITKSIDFLTFLYVEKSALGVGHVSTYKDGSMWKKIQSNPPKWKCIRQGKNFSSETSGAKQSITKLINKVKSCNSTDELLDIVLFNIDRFRDEKGQILPIVEKLKAEVDGRKTDFAISKELSRKYSKREAVNTIKEWATQENFDKAKGKSREKIFFNFGQKLKPIGKISEKYLKLLNPKSGDTRVFCGKGYFIDHMVNHHPNVPLSDYEIIPDVLENPDNVRLDDKKGVPTVIFQKKTDKYGTVVVNCKADGDKVIFYKTGFTGNKESYKNKPSVVDRNPTINPSSVGGNGNVSALPNGNSNIPQSADSVKQKTKGYSDEQKKEIKGFPALYERVQNNIKILAKNEKFAKEYGGLRGLDEEKQKKIKEARIFVPRQKEALKKLFAIISEYGTSDEELKAYEEEAKSVLEKYFIPAFSKKYGEENARVMKKVLEDKEGKRYNRHLKEVEKMLSYIENKNYVGLADMLADDFSAGAKRIVYEQITGEKLPKTQKGTVEYFLNKIKADLSINKSAIIYNNRLYINKSMLAEFNSLFKQEV